jgi:hypothetical protein
MEIAVSDAQNLPDKAFLSIRVGDQRRQMQFKAGEPILFQPQKPQRHFTVDIFEKVGTKQVSLDDFVKGTGQIQVPRTDTGKVMSLDLKIDITSGASIEPKKKDSRQEASAQAKSYLERNGVQKVMQSMMHGLLTEQPEDPFSFMMKYLSENGTFIGTKTSPDQKPSQVSTADTSSVRPRLSSSFNRFAADGSVPLPNLTNHHNVMAEELCRNPGLYDSLKDIRTPLDVQLATCIKTGVDNKGHKMIRMVGLVAGDEHCYDVFRDLFEPVVSRWHGGYAADAKQPLDLDPEKLSSDPIDASGARVVSAHIRGSRSLSGMRFPPACSEQERLTIERTIAEALLSIKGDLAGDYFPLSGSTSCQDRSIGGWAPRQAVMTPQLEQQRYVPIGQTGR